MADLRRKKLLWGVFFTSGAGSQLKTFLLIQITIFGHRLSLVCSDQLLSKHKNEILFIPLPFVFSHPAEEHCGGILLHERNFQRQKAYFRKCRIWYIQDIHYTIYGPYIDAEMGEK